MGYQIKRNNIGKFELFELMMEVCAYKLYNQ